MYWRRVKNNRVSKKNKKIAKIKTYFLIKMSKQFGKNINAFRKNIQMYWRRVKNNRLSKKIKKNSKNNNLFFDKNV